MGASNIEIVETLYERFKALGEPNPGLVGPGCVWDMTNMESWPLQPVWEGPEGIRRFLAEWTAAWDEWQLEVDELRGSGDKVVALVRQQGRSSASGVRVEMSFAQVWTMRDGKYVRMDMYSDRARALAAVFA